MRWWLLAAVSCATSAARPGSTNAPCSTISSSSWSMPTSCYPDPASEVPHPWTWPTLPWWTTLSWPWLWENITWRRLQSTCPDVDSLLTLNWYFLLWWIQVWDSPSLSFTVFSWEEFFYCKSGRQILCWQRYILCGFHPSTFQQNKRSNVCRRTLIFKRLSVQAMVDWWWYFL